MDKIELNKIYNEDCLEGMKRIPDESVDMILCDLPYGTTACKWDSIIPLESLWEHYERVIKENGAIVLTASQPFTTKLISSNMDIYKYNLVWEKPQGVDPFMAKKRPLNNMEDIVIFYKKQPTYNPQYEEGKPYKIERDKKPREYEITNTMMKPTTTINDGKRLPKRILKFKQERGYHPTQKPVPLFEYLIKTYTNEGETVLDNCIGSGTTAIACLNTNRNFIGFEMDKEYFDIATKRIEEHEQ
ncbi:site-specific DNA-methyltransferase [Jeotgalibaca porci]|uniref:DNA-methyltransferase n=1 Tax=Jeotgalibaca porci TaxID=1868793 RepID=UPI0035A0561E